MGNVLYMASSAPKQMVGVRGFEPPTPASRTRKPNSALKLISHNYQMHVAIVTLWQVWQYSAYLMLLSAIPCHKCATRGKS